MELASPKLKKNVLLAISFGFFLMLLNFQMLGLTGWIEKGKSAIKLYQIFGLIFIPLVLRTKLRLKTKGELYVLFFMLLVFLSALFFYPIYGFNKQIINYLFAFYLFFLGQSVQVTLGENRVLKIYQKIIVIVNLIIFVKAIFYFEVIRAFFEKPNGHPLIYYIYGGGANLEATWVTLNSLFFINRKRIFYFFLLFGLGISFVYASRVGVVMGIVIFAFYLFSARVSRAERWKLYIVGFAALLAFGFYLIPKIKDAYVVERFFKIGEKTEKGSQGRIALYTAYIESYSTKSLLGVGPGNAVPYIEAMTCKDFHEDNLHNYFLQVFLEFGALGFLGFLTIVIDIWNKNRKVNFLNPFGIFLLSYLIGCLVQFRGAEVYVWLSFGVFMGYMKNKNNRYI